MQHSVTGQNKNECCFFTFCCVSSLFWENAQHRAKS